MEQRDTIVQADVVVLGAGIYGIQFARTYLEIHPTDTVIILEADTHIGGPWAAHRGYDSFMTQTPVDFAEFSDKPLNIVPKAELFYCHFPARHFTQYLQDYVSGHVYDGKTLRSRIQLRTRVDRVSKVDEVWCIHTVGGKQFASSKLVDATGLTSEPKIPEIPGRKNFCGIQTHHKNFGQSGLLNSSAVRNVVVLGGSKSAADVAYAAVKAGKRVHWVIRKSGTGPSWFVPAYGLGGMASCSTHALWTRLMAPLLASVFAEPTRVSRFLYRSFVGQWVFWKFWASVALAVSWLTDYARVDGRENCFHNLKPDTGPFWANESTSVDNKPDFADTIAGNVHVWREDVLAVHENAVELSDGSQLDADAIVYATGWKCGMSYFDKSLLLKLGLPVAERELEGKDLQYWEKLDQEAEAKIDVEMPMLSRRGPYWKPNKQCTPLRLYKSVLPIEDHSVVLLGKTVIAHAFPAAEVEALWAVAALDGKIVFPSIKAMRKEVALVVAWSRKRYPSRGWQAMWFPWDLVPFTDMLLKQLELSSHRGSTWWGDLTTPTSSHRLKGLVDEYKRRHGE